MKMKLKGIEHCSVKNFKKTFYAVPHLPFSITNMNNTGKEVLESNIDSLISELVSALMKPFKEITTDRKTTVVQAASSNLIIEGKIQKLKQFLLSELSLARAQERNKILDALLEVAAVDDLEEKVAEMFARAFLYPH